MDPRPQTLPQLERSLGLGRATAMVVGTIIGASIFVQPSLVTGAVGTVGGVFLAWGVAGLLTLAGALITAELASAYPDTGGVYAFLRRAYSPGAGFLWAWAMFWSMHTGIIAALAMVFARYAGYFVPLGDLGLRAVAIAVIVVLSLVNVAGVRLGSALQTAVTIAKAGAILVLIVAGFWLGSRVPEHFVAGTGPGGGSIGWGALARAVAAGLFAFGGWHMVTYTAGETRDPEHTLPRALVVGTITVTLAYVALNAVYLYVLPLERVAASQRVAAEAADVLMGRGGGGMLAALVVGSTFGALSGIILVGPRVYYSLARDGLLFSWVGAIHPTYRTPHRAIALQGVWATALVATGTYRVLFSRVVYTEWIFFAAMAVGLLRLRRRPDHRPAYRVAGGAVLPLLFAGCAVLVAVSQIVADPRNSAIGLCLVLVGVPVYVLWTRRRSPTPS
ncbi:MAG TPA: amino acid permease [Gemmatimonadales bacterium]|nr:amino acid permease [Gemmatimonadales bacterium]